MTEGGHEAGRILLALTDYSSTVGQDSYLLIRHFPMISHVHTLVPVTSVRLPFSTRCQMPFAKQQVRPKVEIDGVRTC